MIKQFKGIKTDEFYRYMYKHIAYKNTSKQIGSKIFDSDDKVWLLLIDNEKLIGFVSYTLNKNVCTLEEIFVEEEYRLNGYSYDLIDMILEKEYITKAICNKNSIKLFLNVGFKIKKEYKNWTHVIYER